MSKRLVANRKSGEAIFHITQAAGGTDTILVTGASSDIASAGGVAGLETVLGANINVVTWGCGGVASGAWKISRGGGTLLILNNSGSIDFAGLGQAMTLDSGNDIVCALQNATEGFLTIELQKKSTVTNDQYLRG